MIQDFLKYGGQPEWILKGLPAIPKKLQNLKELNILLAYKPWAIRSSSLIKELVKGKEQWNISELMHAMIIMSFYHSWSCFCFANGLKLEEDLIISKNLEAPARKKTSFDVIGSEKIEESRFFFLNIYFIIKQKILRSYHF